MFVGKYIIQVDFSSSPNVPIFLEYKNPVESLKFESLGSWSTPKIQEKPDTPFIVEVTCKAGKSCEKVPVSLLSDANLGLSSTGFLNSEIFSISSKV
jgi:hypothetical protein